MGTFMNKNDYRATVIIDIRGRKSEMIQFLREEVDINESWYF
jgi:hypothetical protein